MSKIFYALCFILLQTIFAANTKKIWMGWTVRESGKDGYCQVLGDRGNAFGKYQFDRRYGLKPFMQYCYNYNKNTYSKFKPFIDMAEINQNNNDLASLWKVYCTKNAAEFGKLQDIVALTQYYEEARKYFKNLYGIDVDTRSPALKGSLFSMAIRSGALSAAKKFQGANFNDDLSMMTTAYGTYGTSDDNRWTRARQFGDAIIAYENNQGDLVPTSM
jgi:hypothetical protein